VLLCALPGCAAPARVGAPSADWRPPEAATEPSLAPFHVRYGTCGAYALRGERSDFDERFDQAAAAMAEGRFDRAGERFFDAARLAPAAQGAAAATPDEASDRVTAGRNRRIAYADAVLAWLSADRLAHARERLLEAAARDPGNAPLLRRWAEELPEPPRCGD